MRNCLQDLPVQRKRRGKFTEKQFNERNALLENSELFKTQPPPLIGKKIINIFNCQTEKFCRRKEEVTK